MPVTTTKTTKTEPLQPIGMLGAAIEDATGEACEYSTRKLIELATDRKIKATRTANGRWGFLMSDVGAIAAALPRKVLAR